MIKYQNEFGEVKRKKRSRVTVSQPVLRDLEALKIYPDEPMDSVIVRLLQSMNPEEMTEVIFKKLRDINAKMRAGWGSQLKKRYRMVSRRQLNKKEWVRKLYEDAIREAES